MVVYLRHLEPVRLQPEPVAGHALTVPGAVEEAYAGKDYAIANQRSVRARRARRQRRIARTAGGL